VKAAAWTALALGGGGLAAVAWFIVRSTGESEDGGESPPPGTNPVRNPDDEDSYALARAIQSEEGTKSEAIRTAVGWAVVNMANKHGVSVTALVKQNSGNYSGQGAGANWYVSTAQEPSPANQALASLIIAGEIPDPTQGATNFDSPRAQRALLGRRPDYTRTPEEVADSRRASGLRLVLVAGTPEEEFRLWTPQA
jgi:spore germination cell wall hydrolase CwlJ-like protein